MLKNSLAVLVIVAAALPAANPTLGLQEKSGIAGTTWSGAETLADFDVLTCQFNAGGEIILIDAKNPERGSVRGNWKQKGTTVEMRFPDCVYRGCIDGNAITGTAEFNDRGRPKWTWKVTKR